MVSFHHGFPVFLVWVQELLRYDWAVLPSIARLGAPLHPSLLCDAVPDTKPVAPESGDEYDGQYGACGFLLGGVFCRLTEA